MARNRSKNGGCAAVKSDDSDGAGCVKKSISMPEDLLEASMQKAKKQQRTLSGYLAFLAAKDCGMIDKSVTA